LGEGDDLGERALGAGDDLSACAGGDDAAAPALEQGDAEQGFDLLDLLAEGGLADAAAARGAAKVADLGDGDYEGELAQGGGLGHSGGANAA
jgi:hypothetical protein